MCDLNNEYVSYIMSDIKKHRGEREELRKQLEGLFGSYDELMECTLYFYREMINKGVIAGLAIKRLKRMGVDVDKLYSKYNKNVISSDEDRADYKILLSQREKVKNGLKIAYKQSASVEKCVELYTKYQNIDMVAEELDVSGMTVRRRLKEAGL